jgi:FkbM family methyltransferase
MSDISFIKKEIGNPKIIFEFGFYDGDDTIAYKNNFPECNIYAFEPDLINFSFYKEKLLVQGIHVYNYAISNKTGEIPFYVREFIKETNGKPKGYHSPGCGIIKTTDYAKKEWNHQKDNDNYIIVPSITIKDFCEKNKISTIDFMHIDVEGALSKVLEGFGNIWPKLIKAETGLNDCYEEMLTRNEYDGLFDKLGYIKLKEKEENTFYLRRKK